MASRVPIPSPVWGCQRTALSRGPGQERPPPRLGHGPLRHLTSAAARALSNNGPRTAGKEITPDRPSDEDPVNEKRWGDEPHVRTG